MKLTILVACLMFGTAALAAENGAELFQKAVTEERAAGNLEALPARRQGIRIGPGACGQSAGAGRPMLREVGPG
jgi:hypothetical protein